MSGTARGTVVRALLIGVLVGCSIGSARAQPAESVLADPWIREHAAAALDDLYRMRYERADSVFQVAESRYPDHPVGPFLRALVTWWKILPSLSVHDTSHDRAFLEEMDRVVRRSDRLLRRDRDSFDGHFFKGAAHGFRGRLYTDRQRWLRAAQDGRSALDHVFAVAEADTSSADALFGVGVYDYFAAAIPHRYPVVRPLMVFFPDGDMRRGLRRLERVTREGTYIRAEAAWFLLQIHFVFEPDYGRSLEYAGWLRENYPENALFHFMEGRVNVRWGRWNDANRIFDEVVRAHEAGTPGYVAPLASQSHYYLGRDAMRHGRFAEAIEHFDRVLGLEEAYEGASFARVHSLLRTGMIFDLRGERQAAVERYRRVLDLPDTGSSHERAERYLDQPYFVE